MALSSPRLATNLKRSLDVLRKKEGINNMKNSQLSLFIEKLKTDEALRQKVSAAENEAASKILRLQQEGDAIMESNLESIKRIAREAGYDFTMDMSRPMKAVTPTEQELESSSCWLFTCCLLGTSVSPDPFPPVTSSGCPDTGLLSECPVVVLS
jgi:hypothetical protein